MKRFLCALGLGVAAAMNVAAMDSSEPIQVLGKPWHCTNGGWRVYCDFKVKTDLADAKGIELETYLSDVKPFAGGTAYLQSGPGWYVAGLELPPTGQWHRVRLDKGKFSGTDGKPAGWRNITRVRIAYSFAVGEKEAKDVDFKVRSLAQFGGDCDVVVLRADAANMKSPDKAIAEYSATVCATLDRLGVRSRLTSDLDVRASDSRNAQGGLWRLLRLRDQRQQRRGDPAVPLPRPSALTECSRRDARCPSRLRSASSQRAGRPLSQCFTASERSRTIHCPPPPHLSTFPSSSYSPNCAHGELENCYNRRHGKTGDRHLFV